MTCFNNSKQIHINVTLLCIEGPRKSLWENNLVKEQREGGWHSHILDVRVDKKLFKNSALNKHNLTSQNVSHVH